MRMSGVANDCPLEACSNAGAALAIPGLLGEALSHALSMPPARLPVDWVEV